MPPRNTRSHNSGTPSTISDEDKRDLVEPQEETAHPADEEAQASPMMQENPIDEGDNVSEAEMVQKPMTVEELQEIADKLFDQTDTFNIADRRAQEGLNETFQSVYYVIVAV
ncbi:hypothetical protein Clacol_000977 [Clathrus columnatus]|uniref:Uncharacterized protein n=1 Tax=Clathrus columnatus TaxID=1419009 RepID=A0AAV4ZXE9_9AGAM|nr:hypothetical protein Clacol_000977 [Clathrus columnatus]